MTRVLALLLVSSCASELPPPRPWDEVLPKPISTELASGVFVKSPEQKWLRSEVDSSLATEGYVISVDDRGVLVRGGSTAGVFYGLVTLAQIDGPSISKGTITDAPRFAWRGLMVDVSRHFFDRAELERIINVMAGYKLNRLHLHLTDDQGWRLESVAYPALTTIGAATEVGGTPGGFFTRDEYTAIVDYAAARFITVVPEIDVPGHTNAALASIPSLNCDGIARAPYTGTTVGFSSLCASRPETHTFIREVISEVAALTPGQWVHIGGDEARMTSNADYVAMIDTARAAVAASGKQLIGWEELARADAGTGTIVQHWLDPSLATGAVARGAKVIVSPAKRAYLDMQYELETPSPNVGTFWAGFVNVQTAYDWDPGTYLVGVPESSVLGVEAAIWTETIDTREQLDSMIFPRVLGLAELAWSPSRDTRDYFRRLAAHGPVLEDAGVAFFRAPQVRWP